MSPFSRFCRSYVDVAAKPIMKLCCVAAAEVFKAVKRYFTDCFRATTWVKKNKQISKTPPCSSFHSFLLQTKKKEKRRCIIIDMFSLPLIIWSAPRHTRWHKIPRNEHENLERGQSKCRNKRTKCSIQHFSSGVAKCFTEIICKMDWLFPGTIREKDWGFMG